jgi:F-type H+-transporting ATPase subunit epsilon
VAFRLDIVAPEAVVWSGEADFVVARTTEGEIGILTGHEPLMSALATGVVVVESGNDTITIGTHGGFLQVLNNQVTLLTDRAEISEGDRADALRIAHGLREQAEQALEEG